MVAVFHFRISRQSPEELVTRMVLRPAIWVYDTVFRFQRAPGTCHRGLSLSWVHVGHTLWYHVLVVVNRTVCVRTLWRSRLTRVRSRVARSTTHGMGIGNLFVLWHHGGVHTNTL